MNAARSNDWSLLFIAWLTSLFATLGSLFFSEIMHFPPCAFCWYQRIAMYPLVVILVAGLFPLDLSVVRYSLPLAVIGWLTSLYHNLLTWGLIPASASPCSQGVSCATKYIQWLGFITIPLLALFAFSIIIGLLLALRRRN